MPAPATFAWLREFHRQWLAARGRKLGTRSRAFSRDWNRLLDDAGVIKAEDVNTAAREAGALHQQGVLVLKRHKYRHHLIEGISLPLKSETWLRDLFQSDSPHTLLDASVDHVSKAANLRHPLYPTLWAEWCTDILLSFSDGRNRRPLLWRSPAGVREVLELAFNLTAREWPEGTLIREASIALGMDSKDLERRQRIAESALSSLFKQLMPLEGLGIVSTELRAEMAGPLRLHFPDGSSLSMDNSQGVYHLTSDLERAVRITTSATRFLTVENSKTTLKRLATENENQSSLMAACAFPTRGLKRVLELLPSDLPLFHFGDTDPAGFHILAKLRAIAPRHVTPWQMQRRLRPETVALTDYDRSLLPRLLVDPLLADVRETLEDIQRSGDKGDYEQETLTIL